MDPQAWVNALAGGMALLIGKAIEGLTSILSGKAQATWADIGAAFQKSDANFVTRTPPAISYNLGGIADLYRQWDPLITAAISVSIFFAGIAAVGRQYWGWSWAPGEWAARLFLGTELATGTMHIYIITIDMLNRMCDMIVGADIPNPPGSGTVDPVALVVLLVVWIVLGMRVAWRMAYRLVYLDVMLILGPLAMLCWVIPGGAPYAAYWARTYVGLLAGQLLVVICFKLASLIASPVGSTWAGIALAIGVLLLAHDMATMFAEIKGGGFFGLVKKAAGAAAAAI